MNRFRVENETVLDTKTNLMWMQNQLDGEFTFDEANSINHEFAGFNDWRLPTIEELSSIINYQSNPAYFEEFRFEVIDSRFWSSSPYVGSTYNAWGVIFNNGNVDDYYFRYNAFPVRLVRNNVGELK